ncbi:MAG: nucleotidyltransferase family protein [Flavobacteriales bacterium]
MALKALQVAEEKVRYQTVKHYDRRQIINMLKDLLSKVAAIKKAWIFGSFAREDDRAESDVDIAVETETTFSYFQLAEIQHEMEMAINRKVDIGFIKSIKPHIMDLVKKEMKLIYERSTN